MLVAQYKKSKSTCNSLPCFQVVAILHGFQKSLSIVWKHRRNICGTYATRSEDVPDVGNLSLILTFLCNILSRICCRMACFEDWRKNREEITKRRGGVAERMNENRKQKVEFTVGKRITFLVVRMHRRMYDEW